MDITKRYSEMKKRTKCELKIITPEFARKALDKNDNNRKVKVRHLETLREDLNSGLWEFETWDCIAFDECGNLLNGQHRLKVVAETDIPIIAFVITGMRDPAVETGDNSVKRLFDDVLCMRGVPNYRAVAGITRWVAKWERGNMFRSECGGNNAFSNRVLDGVLERNEDIHDSAAWLKSVNQSLKTIGRGQIIAAVRCVAAKKHPTKAAVFFDQVALGTDLKVGSPALALRNRFQQILLDRNMRIDSGVAALLVAHAWNTALHGRNMRVLRTPKEDIEVM